LKDFEKATECKFCRKPFTHTDKVFDHCHYTGRYRAASCNACNILVQQRRKINIFFHNLEGNSECIFVQTINDICEGFDSHLLLTQYIETDEKKGEKFFDFKVIPTNSEKIKGEWKYKTTFSYLTYFTERILMGAF